MSDDRTVVLPDDDDDDRTLAGEPLDDDATIVGPGPDADQTIVIPADGEAGELGDDHPERIGPYKLIRLIGEGGMGLVYQAEQSEPFRRTVALKIIRKGMDTAEFVSRFASERQALALMDHPAIATVYDAGATERGRPYFVMEYVAGVPLGEYCNGSRLTIKQRLELFIQVCEGVTHAHQKAIIHRDLKPSNVLVTELDGHPQPKIIDFGVAKATDRDLTENTMQTGLGQVLGTPAYMSPEQADLDGRAVDTRTDVYALGVILYELLSGGRPFPRKTLESAGFREAMRMIREDDPPRPSARLTSLSADRQEIAEQRSVGAAHLQRALRGDLDWIVMKALEKDPDRRYTTAYGLAQDIKRYLTHQPVSAGPPSASYKVGKFVRRHRTGVAAGLVVTVAVIMGIIGTTTGMIRAVRAEKLASEEAATATRVADFLVDLFEVSDPDNARGETITAREVLDQGASRVEEELADQPQIRARLMTTIGKVYRNLGLYQQAGDHLETAVHLRRNVLGEDDAALATSLIELGDLCIATAHYDDAKVHLQRALEVIGQGPGTDNIALANSLHDLASVYRREGNYEEAGPLYRRARELRLAELGPADPEVARSDNSLAILAWNMGEYGEAERLYEQALAVWEGAYGSDHADVAKGLNNLALLYHQLDRFEDAEPLYRRAVGIYERILGPDHPRLAVAVNNLALVCQDQERLDEAAVLYERALAIRETSLGPEHPDVAQTLNNLANLRRTAERYEEAEILYRRALAIRRGTLGPTHQDVAWTLRDLGVLASLRGDAEEAALIFEQAVAISRTAVGDDHPDLAEIFDSYAPVLVDLERTAEAGAIYERALAIRKASLAADNPDLARTSHKLANLHRDQGRQDLADPLYRQAVAIFVAAGGDDNPDLVDILEDFASSLRATGRTAAADSLLGRATLLRETSARHDS